MKKFFKKSAAFCMAFISIFVVGCSGESGENGGNPDASVVLNIITIDKGYGTDWLSSLARLFESEHSDVSVRIKKEVVDTNVTKFLDSGAGNSDYDLYFTGSSLKNYIKATIQGVEDVLADITDVYEYRPNGDLSTADLLDESLLSAYKQSKDGKDAYYTLPWTQGINGLLVNFDVVNNALGENWQQIYPCRTTEELLDFCKALKSAGVFPFIYAADTQYYQFLYSAWWAQYEGLEGIEDYYNGTAYDPAQGKDVTPSKLIFKQQGRLEAMKVMESLMTEDYVNPVSTGIQWDAMQTRFMAGQAAMLSNGDWNNIEMSRSFPNSNVRLVKVPIVSSLGTKLGITESELSSVVEYVDSVLDGVSASVPTLNPTGDYTQEEIIDTVKEARRVVATYAEAHTVAIPAWSKNIELAKDFLRLMISDRGQDVYAKAMKGEATLPFGYDITKSDWFEGISAGAKARWKIAKNAKYFYEHTELTLGSGGLMAFRAVYSAPIEHLLYKQKWTAQEILDVDIDYYGSGTAWSNLLELSGLL